MSLLMKHKGQVHPKGKPIEIEYCKTKIYLTLYGNRPNYLTWKYFYLIFRDAIILVMYCPENARIKKKMLYSSSFDYVKRAFTGVSVVAPINDDADLTEEFIHEKATERLRK